MDYYGKLWFGSTMTELTLTPDTGSEYLAVCAGTSSKCDGDKFEYDNVRAPSTSF